MTQSQEASNSNSTTQDASARSKAEQTLPVNAYVPVCVAKRCDSGDIRQANTNRSGDAWAGNVNHTGQSNEQSQKGVGGNASTGDATRERRLLQAARASEGRVPAERRQGERQELPAACVRQGMHDGRPRARHDVGEREGR